MKDVNGTYPGDWMAKNQQVILAALTSIKRDLQEAARVASRNSRYTPDPNG
jgi:hypothetical protein